MGERMKISNSRTPTIDGRLYYPGLFSRGSERWSLSLVPNIIEKPRRVALVRKDCPRPHWPLDDVVLLSYDPPQHDSV